MFERFTDRARKVVILAKGKAAERGDDQIRPVHMLYGLVSTYGMAASALSALGVDSAAVERELGRRSPAGEHRGETTSDDAEALAAIGIDLDEIRRRIEDSFGPDALERVPLTPKGPLNWTGFGVHPPLNDQAKLSLALSFKEARALHHHYVGTEHVLLGLLRAAERYPRGEFATATLPSLGLDPATAHGRVLTEVRQMLRGTRPSR